MKKFKVYWTKEAEIDLEQIIDYIFNQRISSARKVYKDIKLKCSNLRNTLQRYRIVPELLEIGIKTYREIVSKPYRVIYKLTEKEVYVIAVVDSRRDFETFIFNRLVRE